MIHPLASPMPDIALAWCDLACDPDTIALLRARLSPAERARAARFGRPALEARYVAGRGMLRGWLARQLGGSPEEIAIARGARGRPYLVDVADADFNVTHTGTTALFALYRGTRRGRRVGVDIEHRTRAPGVARLVRRVMTSRERAWLETLDETPRREAFLALWTCKEAMSKASGDGIAAPFGRIDVSLGPPRRVLDGPAPYAPGPWQLLDVDAIPGHVATVAVWDAAPS